LLQDEERGKKRKIMRAGKKARREPKSRLGILNNGRKVEPHWAMNEMGTGQRETGKWGTMAGVERFQQNRGKKEGQLIPTGKEGGIAPNW